MTDSSEELSDMRPNNPTSHVQGLMSQGIQILRHNKIEGFVSGKKKKNKKTALKILLNVVKNLSI